MSRIRNILRFQSPEERVLNGLLVVVLALLATVGIVKARDHEAVAASEVRGISVTRPQTPATTTSTTTTTAPETTTTTSALSKEAIWLLAEADNAREAARSTTTTTTAPFVGFPVVVPPVGPGPTTTTRPAPTTTTSTTSTTTTTTTTLPISAG